jgi:hypothetical protein
MLSTAAAKRSARQGNFDPYKATPGGALTPTEGLTTRRGDLLMAGTNLMDRGALASAHDNPYSQQAGPSDG